MTNLVCLWSVDLKGIEAWYYQSQIDTGTGFFSFLLVFGFVFLPHFHAQNMQANAFEFGLKHFTQNVQTSNR